jgi:hypothetical protein
VPSQPSAFLADKLARQFRLLERTRANIDTLVAGGLLTDDAADRMYEALFLSAHVAIEGFIEELFLGLLVSNRGVRSSRGDIKPRIEVRSHRIARELITGAGRKYVDWLPYDRTVDLAKLFFRGGRPFDDLTQTQKQLLSRGHIIRNAIAHRSRYSLGQFERHVIFSTPLPPKERQPAGYLRGLFRASPAQTRFSNLLAQLLLVARDLAR